MRFDQKPRVWMTGLPIATAEPEKDNLSKMKLGPLPSQTPYQRGRSDGVAGKAAPPFPSPRSSWAERLYHSGWCTGADERTAAQTATPIQ